MTKSILLPSIASLLNREDHDSNIRTDLKLPKLTKRDYDESRDHRYLSQDDNHKSSTFLPISPLSLSSSSPRPPCNTQFPCPPLSPLSPLPSSTLHLLPHTINDSLTHKSPSSLSPTIQIQSPPEIRIPKESQRPQPQSKSSEKKPASISFKPAPQIQIIHTSLTDGPILKRRRGRPPLFTEYHSQSDPTQDHKWTFLTPTVWNVKPSSPYRPPSGLMTTFSSITLESELNTSRGRRAKEIERGSSCFAWKDVSIVRSTSPKKKLKRRQGQAK